MTPTRSRGASSFVAAKTPPPRVRTLPPSAFADSWRMKPHGPTKVGIRLVSEDVLAKAQQLAIDFTKERLEVPEPIVPSAFETLWITMFNSQVMRCVLCHAITKPDDVSTRFFESGPVNMIEVALKPETMRALWEDYGELSQELSPVTPEATDEEIAALSAMLALDSMFAGIDPDRQRRLRRRLTRLREDLIDSFPEG